jgi:hypothetical protein
MHHRSKRTEGRNVRATVPREREGGRDLRDEAMFVGDEVVVELQSISSDVSHLFCCA